MRVLDRLAIAGAVLIAGSAAMGQAAPAPAAAAGEADTALAALADRMVALTVSYDPTSAYAIGVPAPDHRRWPDRSPAAMAAFEREADALLAALGEVDPARLSPQWGAIHAGMAESLEADRQTRVCRYELWAVSHMSGWHLGLANVARDQPVATAGDRAQALERWAALPALIDQEIANARRGLDQGYSAPKAVVARVVRQVDGLVSAEPESLPFFAMAQRTEDEAFKARLREILAGPVREAFRRYRDFLRDDYQPRARDSLGVAANPNGAECYRASLRSYTTLDRSPQDVFELGQQTVAANLERVRELGRAAFGSDDPSVIVPRIQLG